MLHENASIQIKMNGVPASFSSGWVPVSATISFRPVILLVLLHTTGSEACWVLDEAGNYLSNDLQSLTDTLVKEISKHTAVILQDLVNGFLKSTILPAKVDFFYLSPAMRADLLKLASLPPLPAPSAIATRDFVSAVSFEEGNNLPLLAEHVREIVLRPAEEAYLLGCRSKSVTWPSPVDGLPAEEARGLVLSHLMICWRCIDRRNNIVFFVYAAGFGSPASSLFVPSANLVVCADTLGAGQLSIASDPTYITSTIQHFFHHGRELLGFLCKPVSRMAHYMWGEGAIHVGHHHWNELPGLEKIISRLDPVDYPLIYDIAGGAGQSFYDDILLLFPELKGRVDLASSTFDAMCSHAYVRGIQLLRFGGVHISANIRRRISRALALVGSSAEARRVRQTETGPIVVFGLRVENRTLTEPLTFYAELGKRLALTYGSATIIVDGHNISKGGIKRTFASYMEQRASVQPIDIEQQFVADLRMALQQYHVRIIDCVGTTLRENLSWMEFADICVAPWGAGLAKYRWALNLPAYVLVGSHCRVSKGDINIYTGSNDMEDPTELRFVSQAFITDRPDLPTLVKMDAVYEPYYVNYDVETDQVVGEVMTFLTEQMRDRQSSAGAVT